MQKTPEMVVAAAASKEWAAANMVRRSRCIGKAMFLGFQLLKSWKPYLNLCYANRNHAASTLAIR
jgi:hypothetical protein